MLNDNKILEPAVVLDVEDPMMLNRIRARVLTLDYEAIIKSIDPVFDESKDKWGERDPFVFTPLLPFYIYCTPKKDELVQVLFANKDYKFDNQYYIQSNMSSPMVSGFDYYVQGTKYTGTGKRYKEGISIKNIDGTHREPSKTYGVFPEPGDNAVMGRGNSDIVIKENEILIRSGKIKGGLSKNKLPVSNTQRGFIQLSKFDSEIVKNQKEKFYEVTETILKTKYLIEWHVTNPENNQNVFNGSVYLYKLKPSDKIDTDKISVNSDLEDLKSITAKVEFTNLSLDDTIVFINGFISDCNSKTKTSNGQVLFENEDKFPMFFRPSPLNYSIITSNQSNFIIAKNNLIKIYDKVKLFDSVKNGGFGLIFNKNLLGNQFDIKEKTIEPRTFTTINRTYATIGSDKVYLLSHLSSIPRKGKINFDGTIYGINAETFSNEIEPKTSSMVRGEELLELLNLMIRFMVSHTHAYPGLPPVPVTEDGSTSASILEEFANAVNKILNQNIRIN